MATKSDVRAKKAFIVYLEKQGYTGARIISQPADIEAWKDGERYYFEIKMTKQTKSYFGAATTTEWNAAIENQGRYFFVIAVTNKDEKQFQFKIFTPEEFLIFSSIPPFKIFFNIKLKGLFDNAVIQETPLNFKDSDTEIVKKMEDGCPNKEKSKAKKSERRSTKLTPDNLKKLIDFYNRLIRDQQ
ncbi:MAG: DUF3883 domain-containing protein [Candidatus Gastranaerophilales bacterium]|nr:DUF3883 domain-containing protein [Candidatus Gastranaerophilales bacterium]